MNNDFCKPVEYDNVYLLGLGAFLPGAPVGNERIDDYIAPLNRQSARIKARVLGDNGIQTRHYAIDEQGQTRHSSSAMAAHAVRDCLDRAGIGLGEVSMLCTGTSGGDVGMPGFANMLQGELAAQPMETSSHQGVCAAGVTALKHAAAAVALGHHRKALVATSEFPSRMFKRSRFAPNGYDADFDSHFLRWMLSDGAGAMLLGDKPGANGLALRLKWVHMKSFSGDYPVCMQIGHSDDDVTRSYLDYDSLADAEREGAFLLRQNLRLLPNLFDVGIHEYVQLVNAGSIDPASVDHFLCHYSSEKFRGVVDDLMEAAGLRIPQDRWYSNLTKRGNTGAASIFIMLADFLRETTLEPGQKILCFVPESGRFTVSFLMLEVETDPAAPHADPEPLRLPETRVAPPPHEAAQTETGPTARLLRDLAEVWHHYRSRMWRTKFVQKVSAGTLTIDDYRRWMECWTPQVREGTLWMRRAVDNLEGQYAGLRELILHHAGEEQFDYRVLFDDYRNAGGTASHVGALRRNSGGEALNAYMHARAGMLNPVGLLGGIYIIEGTGQRIIPALLPVLRQQAGLEEHQLNFLRYHGENDEHHLQRWLAAVEMVVAIGGEDACADILATARAVADLYALQMECVL
ncbi:iron-containing redox enzyme family protein [Lysobacter niastensis]|uniref:Iron-containing redox enzyme family protein n=1 Tax=Lysobacter niastensis TaxID=380629 RepID=A0ABS0B3P6_9GAMM|nr:iron-containing redox enzyme family protein [Lysobacter niastensis]MBF6023098.1 iron-containing redox enzyme family protein [Lysobacter niastensis]